MFNKDTILKYIGWLVATFFVYFQFLIQTSASVMQSEWMQYFHINSLGVSFLSASFFYAYLFFQIPVGVIYDKCNTKKVLALASFGLGIGCILFSNTNNYVFALFARMFMGACAAFGFIGMLKVTANYFPGKQFSVMMGFSEALAAISTILGVTLLASCIKHLTWQTMMVYLSVCVFFISFSVIILIKSPNANVEKDKENFLSLIKNIFSVLKIPNVFITGMYGFFMFSVVNCFNSLWGIAFLTEAYGITSENAAKIMSTVFLGLALGCPLNGYFSKKYGRECDGMKICSIICALCMAIILYQKVPIGILYLLFFLVGLMCAVYVQAFVVVNQSVPIKLQATSMSITNMLIMSSAPVLQILVGFILNDNFFNFARNYHQKFQFALSVLPIGMVLAFVLCFFIRNNLNASNSAKLAMS